MPVSAQQTSQASILLTAAAFKALWSWSHWDPKP
jgi:hypothetical protein